MIWASLLYLEIMNETQIYTLSRKVFSCDFFQSREWKNFSIGNLFIVDVRRWKYYTLNHWLISRRSTSDILQTFDISFRWFIVVTRMDLKKLAESLSASRELDGQQGSVDNIVTCDKGTYRAVNMLGNFIPRTRLTEKRLCDFLLLFFVIIRHPWHSVTQEQKIRKIKTVSRRLFGQENRNESRA